MAQNTEFKNSTLLVDSNLIGLLNRTKPEGAVLNYALRVNWGVSDRLKGVLGSYYVNVPATQNSPANLLNLGKGSSDLGNSAIAKEVESIPITLTEIPANDNVVKYLVELDDEAWNQLAFESESKDLLRQEIEEEGVAEGDPNWEYFLKTGFNGSILVPQGNAPTIPPVFNNGNQTFSDLSTFYYSVSNDEKIREESGVVVKVEPIYNFYVDTTPPYEQVSKKVSEPMLTNFYCLESEIRNTGSTLNSADYFDQITLAGALQQVNIDGDDQPDPWFQQAAGPAGGFTESKTTQFYTLYSKGVNIISTQNGIASLKGQFEQRYKNMVILNSDIKALNNLVIRDDQTSGLGNMPFYNKITLGVDHNNVSDLSDTFNGASFFRALMADPDFESSASFMDILQLYIVQNILNGTSTSTTFQSKTVVKKSPTNPLLSDISINRSAPALYFDLKTFMDDVINENPRIQQIIDRINTNTTTSDNFILIRNYNSPSGLVEASQQSVDNFVLLNEDDRINYPIRDFDDIINNTPCYNEPIMYKIDKRIINANGNISEPVQTFFIGKSFANEEMTYIDTQVKYGVRYQYDIKQIRMVFGNTYSYKDLKIFFSSVAGYGGAVGNALGFYRPPDPVLVLDDYIEGTVQEYTSMGSDTQESAAGENTSLSGYYIFRPENWDDFVGGANQTVFDQLFAAGTNFVHANEILAESALDDREILGSIGITIKEGFGFNGNSEGGAVSSNLNIVVPPQTVADSDDGAELPEGLREPDVPSDPNIPGGAPGFPGSSPGGSVLGPGTTSYIAPDILRDLMKRKN